MGGVMTACRWMGSYLEIEGRNFYAEGTVRLAGWLAEEKYKCDYRGLSSS